MSALTSKDYPATLRRVVVRDEAGKRVTMLTNNFLPSPELIAALSGPHRHHLDRPPVR